MKGSIDNLRPMLAVTDLARTIAFYRDKIGFTLEATFGDPPVWCSMHREGQGIMFNAPPDVAKDVPRRSRDYQIFYFNTPDVAALRAELQKRGASVTDLRVTVYGMKEFEVRDPDGIWLWFGEGTDEPPTVKE